MFVQVRKQGNHHPRYVCGPAGPSFDVETVSRFIQMYFPATYPGCTPVFTSNERIVLSSGSLAFPVYGIIQSGML
jgi:hypothetical protein